MISDDLMPVQQNEASVEEIVFIRKIREVWTVEQCHTIMDWLPIRTIQNIVPLLPRSERVYFKVGKYSQMEGVL